MQSFLSVFFSLSPFLALTQLHLLHHDVYHLDFHMPIPKLYLHPPFDCAYVYIQIGPQSNDNICFALQIYNHRRYGYVIKYNFFFFST